jgi:hypothetical protein
MRFVVAIILASITARSFAADREPASLVPGQLLAYVELRDPSAIAEAWAGWMKGTAFDGTLKTASDRRDRATEFKHLTAIPQLGQIGLIATPEARSEIRKLKGAAVALTGFDERGNPDYVAYVLTGESAVAGLLARSFLTTSPDIRRVATVDGVPLFQHRVPPTPQYDANGKPIPNPPDVAKLDESMLTYASAPGLFVVASRPKLVEDTLKRWNGKGKDSLAEMPQIGKVSNNKTGAIVAVAFPQKLFAAYSESLKKSGIEVDPDWFAWLRFVVKPEAIQTLTASISVFNDGWDITALIDLDNRSHSPLLGLLGERAATSSQRGMGLTIAVPERNAESIIAFADAVATASGVVGRLPSDIVAKAERETGAKWAKELLPSMKSVSFDWGPRNEAQSKPALLLTFESSGDAWESAIPGLLRAADPNGHAVTPSEEMNGSIKVKSYALRSGPWSALHMARSGNRLAIATSRADAVRVISSQPSTEKSTAALVGRIAPEWFALCDDVKPVLVKSPVAPPPTLVGALKQFPPINLTMSRVDASKRVTATLSHRSWNGTSAKSATTAFADWLEHMIVEKGNPQSDLIPGGMFR